MKEQSEATRIAVLAEQFKNLNEKVDHLQDGIDIINNKLDERYVLKTEFDDFKTDFIFWRNSFIGGIIFLLVSLIFMFLKK